MRPQIACGTHALAVALSGNLRPGDELLSPVGKPYDTLEEVIGIRPSKGSLAEYGVTYRQVDLMRGRILRLCRPSEAALNEKTKLVTIQRSKGYQTRPTLSVTADRRADRIYQRKIKPDVICMVDNCYGEFVERIEPTDVGADLMRRLPDQESGRRPGSHRRLYRRQRAVCGKRGLPSDIPGTGQGGGRFPGRHDQSFYQGFFLAPYRDGCSLKGRDFRSQYL